MFFYHFCKFCQCHWCVRLLWHYYWASAWDFQQCVMCDQQSLRSACAYAQSDQSLYWSLEYSMIVRLLTEHHLEFLSLIWGCTGSSESTLVKMPHCWKSHALAQFCYRICHLKIRRKHHSGVWRMANWYFILILFHSHHRLEAIGSILIETHIFSFSFFYLNDIGLNLTKLPHSLICCLLAQLLELKQWALF